MGRVLVAEDDAAMLEMVTRALVSDGHIVAGAHDGQEALDLLAAKGAAFDVMLTDFHMPGIDGIELATKAVAMLPTLRVLLMSADNDVDVPAALKRHIAQVLSKPLAIEKMRAAVRAALS